MGKNLTDSISDWLEKGGYPLELYAAKELNRLGFSCSKSPFYIDTESDKPREIDVIAWELLKNNLKQHLSLKIVVECKKSKFPFVILCEKSEENTILENTISANWIMDRDGIFLSMAKFIKAEQGEDYYSEISLNISKTKCRQGYSIVQAHQKNDADVYGEVYKLAKAYQWEKKQDESYFDEMMSKEKTKREVENSFDTQIPVLLIDAPLVEVYIDKNNQTIVEEKEISSISLKLPWQDHHDNEVSIAVIKKQNFGSFLADVLHLHKDILDQQEYVNNYWKSIDKIPEEKRTYTRFFKEKEEG